MAVTTYTALTNEQRTFYQARLIQRLLPFIPLMKDSQKTTVGRNTGTAIQWRTWPAIGSLATTALTEGTPPTEVAVTVNIITATLAQYGAFVKVSDLLVIAGIDPAMEQIQDLLSEQAGRSIHTLIVNALAGGTNVQYATGVAGRINLTAAMTLTMTEVRKAVRTLKKNNVPRFPDGYYHGTLTPSQFYDLRSDTSTGGMTWAAANTYVNTENFQKGTLGAVEGVMFYETSTDNPIFPTGGAGGVPVHIAFIYGPGAYGTGDLVTQTVPDIDAQTNRGIDVMVVPANTPSKIDPLQQYGLAGWKVAFTVALLDNARLVRIETGVSAGG